MGLIGKTPESVSIGRTLPPLAAPRASTSAILGLVGAAAIYISVISAPGVSGVLGAGLAVVMLAIAIIDGRRFIIPDWLNAAGIMLAIVYAGVREPEAMEQAVVVATLRGLAVALVFFSLRYAYAKLRGRQGLGFGDVKLGLRCRNLARLDDHSYCDRVGGVCSDNNLCAATVNIGAADFSDHAHALWPLFRAGNLDLLGDRDEVVPVSLKAKLAKE